jgi:GT2 family glycosyltransferase
VDFVLGAALMVRGAAIEQVGGLDTDFFLYCEEMDWCLRLAEAGWVTLAVPGARVIHHEGQSTRQVRWPAYVRLWRSRLRFYQKHARRYPPGYLWWVRALVRVGMRWRAWRAERSFAHGVLTGGEVAAELAAYDTIARL